MEPEPAAKRARTATVAETAVQATHPTLASPPPPPGPPARDRPPPLAHSTGVGPPPCRPSVAREADQVNQPILHETKLLATPGLSIAIAAGSRLWLMNRGENTASLEKWTFLAGFFKGKWWQRKSGQPAAEDLGRNVPFVLCGAHDVVQLGGTCSTIGLLINQRRATSPADAKVCYHELLDQPEPGNPGHFTLHMKHELLFKAEDLPVKVKKEEEDGTVPQATTVLQCHLASALPWSAWNTDLSTVVWVLKWTRAKGLQPVRPVVVTTGRIDIPAGQAVELKAGGTDDAAAAADAAPLVAAPAAGPDAE